MSAIITGTFIKSFVRSSQTLENCSQKADFTISFHPMKLAFMSKKVTNINHWFQEASVVVTV